LKIIGAIFGILITLIIGVYLFLFTSMGHGIILPMIQNNIKDATNIQNVKVTNFDLSLSSLDIELNIENQKIVADAKFNLFSQKLDAKYDLKIDDLSVFKELIKTNINGKLYTNGDINGTFKLFDIKGIASLANGNIDYNLNVDTKNSLVNNIIFDIKKLDISQLLSMLEQPKYIQGKLNANGKISSQNLENIDFIAYVNSGKVNTQVVKKALDIVVPKSDFTLDSKINIKNKVGEYKVDLASSLATIKSDGKLNLLKMGVDSIYSLDVKSLALLEPIIGIKLNGAFNTSGTIKGDKKSMIVDGKSNIASSLTKYNVKLKDFQPSLIKANISNAKLDELLFTLNQPKYAKANLDIDAQISSLDKLDGKITTTIKNGILNRSILKKEFELNLPKNSTFNGVVNTKLDDNMVVSNSSIKTFVAKLNTKKTAFDINSAKLTTDYILNIPSLAKLYFISGQKMKGSMVLNGDVIFDKTLLATFHSKKFGGNIDGKLDNDKLSVKTNNIQSLKLLDTMYYPKIFKSTIDANLDYNLSTKKGLSKVNMVDGKFLTNEAMSTLKKLTSYDLTLELYKKSSLVTKIDDTMLYSTLDMKSKNSTITSKKLNLNTAKSTIDGDIKIKYKKYDLGIKLAGAITSPKVKVDIGDALKNKAKDLLNKKLGKDVEKDLKKKLNDKLGEDVRKNLGGLLKGLF
jgi:hypothetical protein